MTRNKTLTKSKIVLEDDGKGLTIYFWKKTFWIFGYWYPFGSSSGNSKIQSYLIDRIDDNAVSKVLYDEFLRTAW